MVKELHLKQTNRKRTFTNLLIMITELKEDFQSLLPNGDNGWFVKKGTKVLIVDEIEDEYLVEYIEYSFYIPKHLLKLTHAT